MKYIFIAVGCWLLLNLLYILIVTPPRRSLWPRQLARTIAAVKRLMQRGRQPPT
jgi:hypothetical protein